MKRPGKDDFLVQTSTKVPLANNYITLTLYYTLLQDFIKKGNIKDESFRVLKRGEIMFSTHTVPDSWSTDRKKQAEQRAQRLYQQVCNRNCLEWIRLALLGRSPWLLDLAEIKAACVGLDYRYMGKQAVRLSQIQGSGSQTRCYDFDANFRPLKVHNRSRWLGVATAWQLGKKLPPIQLIQVGEVYFVEDGHHRISVAKAMGQLEIEAVVTVWEVAKTFPPNE